MKITGFFKTGKHQRFHYEPRHFDPDSEEAQKRERRIRREMGNKEDEIEEIKRYRSSIQGSFVKRRYVDSSVNKKGNLRVLLIILILLGLLYGWWEFGNDVVYSLLLLVPFYVYLRLKRKI